MKAWKKSVRDLFSEILSVPCASEFFSDVFKEVSSLIAYSRTKYNQNNSKLITELGTCGFFIKGENTASAHQL